MIIYIYIYTYIYIYIYIYRSPPPPPPTAPRWLSRRATRATGVGSSQRGGG